MSTQQKHENVETCARCEQERVDMYFDLIVVAKPGTPSDVIDDLAGKLQLALMHDQFGPALEFINDDRLIGFRYPVVNEKDSWNGYLFQITDGYGDPKGEYLIKGETDQYTISINLCEACWIAGQAMIVPEDDRLWEEKQPWWPGMDGSLYTVRRKIVKHAHTLTIRKLQTAPTTKTTPSEE